MPIVLRRPALMELAELVAGATHQTTTSEQTDNSETPYCTKKQPLSGNNLPQSSDPATETVPDVEEHPVVPERTEPWRPLTENEKNALSLEEKEVCTTPWSTNCIENLGIQTSGAWWTVCVKIVLIQQCWPAAKIMHCTACQESARMLSRPVTSGKVNGTWSSPADGQVLLGNTPRRRCMSKAHCWWMPLQERL